MISLYGWLYGSDDILFDRCDVTVGLVPQIGPREAVALRSLAALEG